MATLDQINASRINGSKSKGPVTPEGKTRVSRNGLRHGIYSQVVVLHNEDHSLYVEWREAHLAEWSPVTETEQALVIDIVDARWRLHRLSTLETAAIDFEVERIQPDVEAVFTDLDVPTRTVLGFNSLLTSNRTYEVIQASIRTQHRIIDRAISLLLRLGKIRRPGTSVDSESISTTTTTSAASAQTPENESCTKSQDQTRPTCTAPAAQPKTRPTPVNRTAPYVLDTTICISRPRKIQLAAAA